MKYSTISILLLATLGLGACTGPMGPQGATGSTGATGAKGSTGSSGGSTVIVNPAR